jgi:hypothetical protein
MHECDLHLNLLLKGPIPHVSAPNPLVGGAAFTPARKLMSSRVALMGTNGDSTDGTRLAEKASLCCAVTEKLSPLFL